MAHLFLPPISCLLDAACWPGKESHSLRNRAANSAWARLHTSPVRGLAFTSVARRGEEQAARLACF